MNQLSVRLLRLRRRLRERLHRLQRRRARKGSRKKRQRPNRQSPRPTPDTRVAIRTLPTRDQIQLGADGKYFIADRGDGCRWAEHSRLVEPETGTEVFLHADCPTDFAVGFQPATGEVSIVVN